MPLPTYKRKFTPRQLNALVDDAIRGVFVPMGQGKEFEKALWTLARNPQRTDEDIAAVRDMTKYNWRAAETKAKQVSVDDQADRQLRATHITQDGKLAANIREGVYLIEGQLPLSNIDARIRGIEFRELAEDERPIFHITEGMLQMALAYQHPALAH
jgi:hypothetical protein